MHGCAMGSDSDIKRRKYRPPLIISEVSLSKLLFDIQREPLDAKQLTMLSSTAGVDAELYYAGDLTVLEKPAVAIVGSRAASEQGLARARRLGRELAECGITVVSGLAAGIDTAALTGAMDAGGNTVGVIGTPLNKAYPIENAELQEQIYFDHLLISPFHTSERTFKGNFPKRNRVMAALSDATVIVEASDTSGTLHQAAECSRLGRWLFIAKSLVDNETLTWPKKFLSGKRVRVLTRTADLIDAIIQDREANG